MLVGRITPTFQHPFTTPKDSTEPKYINYFPLIYKVTILLKGFDQMTFHLQMHLIL
ncbi:MAG: hypothetical protein ACM3VV_03485 [Deltaproteobacteria bacterium]